MKLKITRGFTLIEILIATFIFAILASIIMYGLKQMLMAREAMNVRNEQLTELQLAMTILERDIVQICDRPIKDASQNIRPSFMENNKQQQGAIEFTRMGYANPQDAFARSTLQRVGILRKNNNLIRQNWPQLDGIPDAQIQSRVLLHNIKYLSWRFLDKQYKFYDYWPPNTRDADQMPIAIELTLDTQNGSMQRLFNLPQREYEIPNTP